MVWFGLRFCLFFMLGHGQSSEHLGVNHAELRSEGHQHSGKLLTKACWVFWGTNGVHCQIWSCVCSVSTASIGVCVFVSSFPYHSFVVVFSTRNACAGKCVCIQRRKLHSYGATLGLRQPCTFRLYVCACVDVRHDPLKQEFSKNLS